MALVPSAVESSPVAARPRGRAEHWALWLILSCYLLGAVVLTWRLWADPASRVQSGDPEDVDLFAWFMRYAATAVAHGHLPALVTTALNTPRGINVMWNTSFLLPGVLLTPVTLLLGPQVSLTIALTLGFAGSAASLFWVLRRWGASIWPAALGGALYGFSPALVNSAIGHYHMQFAVLPPLIIDAALRIVTGRGRPVRTGVWLGLLVAAQVFIGEELLTLTAVAGVLLVVVVAAGRPRLVLKRALSSALGVATAAAVALVISGYALWEQFRGPLTEHGSPWIPGNFTSSGADLVTPAGNLLVHTGASAADVARTPAGAAAVANGYSPLQEYLGYLGWPLLVVLVAAGIWYWRDPRVRATAVTWAVLELFSLGGNSSHWPWHWLQGLSLLGQVLPDRFAIVADGAAAAALAFALDLALSAAPEASGWQRRGWPFAVAVLALLPLIPLPMHAARVPPVPAGWQAAFGRLGPDARVLVVPVPYSHSPDAMRWQADTGEPASLMGGWFVGPAQGIPANCRRGCRQVPGQATSEYFGGPTWDISVTAKYLDALWAGSPTFGGKPISLASRHWIPLALAYLQPTAVVAVVNSPHSQFERVLWLLFGRPDFRVGQMVVWRHVSLQHVACVVGLCNGH